MPSCVRAAIRSAQLGFLNLAFAAGDFGRGDFGRGDFGRARARDVAGDVVATFSPTCCRAFGPEADLAVTGDVERDQPGFERLTGGTVTCERHCR